MQSMKLNVLFASFSYGGNGGFKSEHPDVRDWLLETIPKAKADYRVGSVMLKDWADTPITMTRNSAVLAARQVGADVLVMVDSDMKPDYANYPGAVPFWDVAFTFIHESWMRGRYMVVGAPYGGAPPFENSMVCRWRTHASDHPDTDLKLELYTREEAAEMGGVRECAALPTGLIAFAMPVFELTEPKSPTDKPWFYYEWEDVYASRKASTEDITATRDISLAGSVAWGYNPIHCAWNSWAGHWKPKCVGKPQLMRSNEVGQKFKDAVERLPRGEERIVLRSSWRDGLHLSAEDAEKLASAGDRTLVPLNGDVP